jgi:hypothetical protein
LRDPRGPRRRSIAGRRSPRHSSSFAMARAVQRPRDTPTTNQEMTMNHLSALSFSAAAIALSLFTGCTQTEAPTPARSIEIADPSGGSRDVTVLQSQRTTTDGYAEVQMGGRDFTVTEWIDTGAGVSHNVVASADGALSYEFIAGPSTRQLVITDAAGTRTVAVGEALGTLDPDAAALLMSIRPPGGDDTIGVAYQYDTYCVYYNTSDPRDWHLEVAACTCAHWYDVFCPRS